MADHSSHNPPLRLARHAAGKPFRPRFRAARAFYLTLFIFTCFATYALFTHSSVASSGASTSPLHLTRDLNGSLSTLDDDEHCRLVHHVEDQCAFVHKHCPTDEAGFSDYLDLYFCKLAHVKPIAAALLVAWLSLLFSTIGIAASDFFCIDLSTIASILGMSESIAGVTFLAFGNGSPDVFSTFAAMSTHSGSLAVGELFGAAGFITAVVAGSMALIRPFKVSKKSFVRDVSFFIVAAAFSLVYLWDGKLRMWECISMVVFYIVYVIFILVWHWWLGRRRRRKEREAAIRGHYTQAGDELEFEDGDYHDDADEDAGSRQSSVVPRGFSREDWSALERASQVSNAGTLEAGDQKDEEVEEEERERWMTEIATQMRLTRPEHGRRTRKNTITPVRPSLVGALEFQAVLKSLHRSQNLQTAPLMMRRFSDDPVFMMAQQEGRLSTAVSDPAAWRGPNRRSTDEISTHIERASLAVPASAGNVPGRMRAVSVNDAVGLRYDPDMARWGEAQPQDNFVEAPSVAATSLRSGASTVLSSNINIPSRSPAVLVEPATPLPDAPIHSADNSAPQSPNFLAPPDALASSRRNDDGYFNQLHPQSQAQTTRHSSHTPLRTPNLPQIVVPEGSGSISPRQAHHGGHHFQDSPLVSSPRSSVTSRPPSLHLPAPMASSEALPFLRPQDSNELNRPNKWWPYSILPPPEVVISALFPTIYHWRGKSWWEKCLGLVALPSVFLLTITLPVVENDRDSEGEPQHAVKQSVSEHVRNKSFGETPGLLESSSEYTDIGGKIDRRDQTPSGVAGHGNTATVATRTEELNHNYGTLQHRDSSFLSEPQVNLYLVPSQDDGRPQLWNRWLAIIQLYLAPIVIVLSLYIQSPLDLSPSWLLMPVLVCLLVSTVLLIPLLCTSTPTHRPPIYRIIFSLIGFVVSIAWISAIASQVVGALKALAVILNMSHAIMGLTIFAVGNSLGDLVADVTVAKLGYPIMALSACFGGPMLNILLGIGLSGSYILIQGAEERQEKHPEKGMHFKVYHIEVSKTLIVSGVTLLLTLVGLLVAVPLNNWIFSRRIGWTLIAVWTITTVGNVLIEVTGWSTQLEPLADWLGVNSGNE